MPKKSTSSAKRSRKPTAARNRPGRRNTEPVSTKVAEYVGTSLGRLLNQRDRLLTQVADLDRKITAARGRVVATVTEGLQGLPTLRDLPGLRGRAARSKKKPAVRTGRKGNRKKHRGKPEETAPPQEALRKMSAVATARTAARKRATARSSR